MTYKQAIEILKSLKIHNKFLFSQRLAIDIAIQALERDKKVDYITEHWNDVSHNFVAACEAFEDILKVYGKGISEEAEHETN